METYRRQNFRSCIIAFIVGPIVFVLLLYLASALPFVTNYLIGPLLFIPNQLGLIERITNDDVIPISLPAENEVTLSKPGRYFIYSTDLLAADDRFLLKSQSTNRQIETVPIPDGQNEYGTAIVDGRPIIEFKVEQAGIYELYLRDLPDPTASYTLSIIPEFPVRNRIILVLSCLIHLGIIGLVGRQIYYWRNKDRLDQEKTTKKEKLDKFEEVMANLKQSPINAQDRYRNKIAKAADTLMQVRASHEAIPTLPADCFPADLAEAYAIQSALVERLLAQHGGEVAGYKIGCTNEAAQQFLRLDEPFYGPLLSAGLYPSPASFRADDFMMRVIEPEFAFELAQDLPPRPEPYSREEVSAAIGAILPAIELVESRYQAWTTVGALCLIADHAVHRGFIPGEAVAEWQQFDLASHEVQLWVNGELRQTGNGAVVLGHPLNALTWLANALSAAGQGLQAGQVVTTGVCVDQVYDAQAGDVIRADFGVLGTVEVRF